MGDSSRSLERAPSLAVLTPRQRDVGQLLSRRYSYKQIARELGISEDRVQKHVNALRERLGLHALSDIAALFNEGAENPPAREAGLPSTGPAWPKPGADEPYVLQRPGGEAMNVLPRTLDPEQPRLVPGLLDGKYRVPVRLGIVVGVIVAVLFTIIIAVAALRSVTEIVAAYPSNRALEHEARP